jgi:hypothetical protein
MRVRFAPILLATFPLLTLSCADEASVSKNPSPAVGVVLQDGSTGGSASNNTVASNGSQDNGTSGAGGSVTSGGSANGNPPAGGGSSNNNPPAGGGSSNNPPAGGGSSNNPPAGGGSSNNPPPSSGSTCHRFHLVDHHGDSENHGACTHHSSCDGSASITGLAISPDGKGFVATGGTITITLSGYSSSKQTIQLRDYNGQIVVHNGVVSANSGQTQTYTVTGVAAGDQIMLDSAPTNSNANYTCDGGQIEPGDSDDCD